MFISYRLRHLDPTRERHEETPHVSNEGNEDPQQPSNPSSGTVAQTPQGTYLLQYVWCCLNYIDFGCWILIEKSNVQREK